MRRRVVGAIVIAVALVAIAGGAIAVAGNDDEGGVTGPQADRAIRSALEATGGGTVGAVERDGENGGTWEVEVTKADGSTVDVRLDDRFDVLTIEGDQESNDSDDGQG
jgi:uncharacterized membrane protein YkoI